MAIFDVPAAVNKIVEMCKVPDIQVMCHCVGSISFFCSALSGNLRGKIRSCVISQVALHPIPDTFRARALAGIALPTMMEKIGMTGLDAYTDNTQKDWKNKLFNVAARFTANVPHECTSVTCQRSAFMYGQLFQHPKLNSDTHDVLHEHLGYASLRAFEHLSAMFRVGKLIPFDVMKEQYLPDDKKDYARRMGYLKFPILFVMGDKNEVFDPKNATITINELKAANPELSKDYSVLMCPGYGHLDPWMGKDAVVDVYPQTIAFLNDVNRRFADARNINLEEKGQEKHRS